MLVCLVFSVVCFCLWDVYLLFVWLFGLLVLDCVYHFVLLGYPFCFRVCMFSTDFVDLCGYCWLFTLLCLFCRFVCMVLLLCA